MLLELMFIEILVLTILSVIVRKKYKKKGKTKEKKPIKQRIKSLKTEQYVIFSIYILLFATAGYFFIANVFPDNPINTNGHYSLEAGDLSMTSKFKSLYLDKDYVLGGKTSIGDSPARLIISEEPFNVVFNPKKVVAEDSSATLQLSLIKPKTEVYFNDKLIIPDLDGYFRVQDFESEEVWIKKDLTKDSYQQSNNAENFIYRNFPQHTIYSFAELSGGTPIIQDYEKTTTRIDTQFRDNLKLAVYAEDSLDIEFVKQDINALVGKDEYTVTITDFQGNEYFKEVYEDDGYKKDTKEKEEQDFEINLKNLPRNIYQISFVKDKNNKYADSTIKDIKINSNKILILGTILPLGEFEFYTKIEGNEKIKFRTWWRDEFSVKITGDLNENFKIEKGEDEFLELLKGEYYLYNKEWKVWISQKPPFAPSKENWFYFPQKADSKLIDSDIIIIDEDKLQINNDEIVYTESIEINEDSKFKIQVLDKLQTYFKDIKLILEEQNSSSLKLIN